MTYVRGDLEKAIQERDARIRELRANGLTQRDVAETPGISSVRETRQRRDERIRELHAGGWTMAAIAAELGVAVGTVHKATKRPFNTYVYG